MDRFCFRVYDKKHKQYIDSDETEMFINNDGSLLFDSFGYVVFPPEDQDNYIVEQCTGLKDKNGNLIYEGDIIRFCLNTRGYVLAYERAVVWDNESASFMIVSNLDQVKPRTKRQMPNIKTHNIEIIGNIHEQKGNK